VDVTNEVFFMAICKETKVTLINDFAQSPGDTGSVEVQIALLTEDIRMLTEHFKAHPKDNASKRGLLCKVSRRKRLMQYLERHDRLKFNEITKRLGLKR
jgi:small subunit ribosomal protein S15